MLIGTGPQFDIKTLARRGVLALGIALAVNWLLLAGSLTTTAIDSYEHLAVGPVTMLTTIGVLGAIFVYAVLVRFTDNPDRLFTRIALVLLVLSFFPNINIILSDDTAPTNAVIVLMVMHVPPAVASIGGLTGRFSLLGAS